MKNYNESVYLLMLPTKSPLLHFRGYQGQFKEVQNPRGGAGGEAQGGPQHRGALPRHNPCLQGPGAGRGVWTA